MNSREKLIEATRTLLWKQGYVGTSPGEIQKLAQVGQGSMYHHFAGKEELALAAIQQNAQEMQTQIAAIFNAKDTNFNKISTYLLRKRDVLKGCRMGKLVQDPDIMFNQKLHQPIQDMFTWIQAQLVNLIADGCKTGEFQKVEPSVLAATITATLQGGYVLARSQNSIKPFNNAVSGLLTLLKSIRVKNTRRK